MAEPVLWLGLVLLVLLLVRLLVVLVWRACPGFGQLLSCSVVYALAYSGNTL